MILNKVNGKFYIGSTKNIPYRKAQHFHGLKKGNHANKILLDAYRKYGEDKLEFIQIASCPVEYLLKLEQWFVDNLHPQYNIRELVSSNLGFKHSSKTKRINV